MSVTPSEREEIKKVLASLSAEDAEREHEENLDKLSTYKLLWDSNIDGRGLLNNKEFELAVEFILLWEAEKYGFGWWRQTKRRFELVKNYS